MTATDVDNDNRTSKKSKPEKGATTALLRALETCGVKFLRYTTVDISNGTRCKAVPLKRLLPAKKDPEILDRTVSIARACLGGLPNFADVIVPGSGLDAAGNFTVRPDLGSLRILPYAPSHAMVMGGLHDQISGEVSPLCTRGLLARVQDLAREEFGLNFCVGAEIEFCLFREGKPVDCSLFGNTTTLNEQGDFLDDLYSQLERQDIEVELVHAESAGGQLEVVLKYQEDVMKIADDIFIAKETIRACAKAHQSRALFLPKISEVQAGSGLHLHFSFQDLQSDDPVRNAFSAEDSGRSVSDKGRSFMEGILSHLPALLSLTLPTSNSYRRVGPGCWTGSTLSWGVEDKEVPLRVCLSAHGGTPTNVEYKLSDATANIYLELAAILSAGLDGVKREISLRPIFGECEAEKLPVSLGASLNCLRRDDFLKGVLGKEITMAYLALKEAEIEVSSKMTLEEEVTLAYKMA